MIRLKDAKLLSKINWTMILFPLWIFGIFLGERILVQYENRPGISAVPPSQWPEGNTTLKLSDKPTLIMFVHPHCPCSEASVNELSEIMAQSQNKLQAYVLFLKPEGTDDAWVHTSLWKKAQEIPQVKVMEDENGEQARLFHASTSGQTILYDAQGHLLFSGGITASRGHFGDNAGMNSIVSFVHGGAVKKKSAFVFGCSLWSHSTQGDKNDFRK